MGKSTLKPNRLDAAVKEANAFKEGLGAKLKKEIKVQEKGHFHLAAIKITVRPNSTTNEATIVPLIFNKATIEGFAKYQSTKYSKVIILHDPTKKETKADA